MKKIMSLFIALTLFLLVGCTREDEVKTFRVMFDSDGGSSVKTQVVEDGKSANKPIVPERDGYTFNGWYLDDTEFDFRNAITKNITLKAKWKENNASTKVTTKKTTTKKTTIKSTTKKKVNNTTTKKTTTKVSDYLVLNENNITLIAGSSVKLSASASKTIVYESYNNNIAYTNNGYLVAVNEGSTLIKATSGTVSDYIKVTVISKDRERIDALKSIMKPRTLSGIGDSIMYEYNGCTVVNTGYVSNTGTYADIENGEVVHIRRRYHEDGVLVAYYTITCGNIRENTVVYHKVLGNY